ncbi:MAG: hypothetical protein IJI57_16465 [Flexilinea sp.]|nr:hypothetical protein [Flexilinea sp.]
MNSKKIFILMLALVLLLGTSLSAVYAQEEVISAESLIGLWKCVDNDQVELRIVPGSYAPLPENASFPELYVEGVWQDPGNRSVLYSIQLNRGKKDNTGILDVLGVNPLITNLVKTVNNSSVDPNYFSYEKGFISVLDKNYDDEYTYTTDAKGAVFAYLADDGTVEFEWLDQYDPHVSGLTFQRAAVEVPSAEVLTEQALRPIIAQETGSEGQAAYDLMKFAADSRIINADADEKHTCKIEKLSV